MSSYSSSTNQAYNSAAEVFNVRLRRPNNSVSWGFNIQGGKEFSSPLLIQKITPNSLADCNGLRPGDYLLKIGNRSVESFSHNDARNAIIEQANELDLIVQRHVIPKHEDFHAQHNFSNVQYKLPESDEQKAKASPQVSVTLKDNRVLTSQSYNTPLGLYSKENIATTLAATMQSPEPSLYNNNNNLIKTNSFSIRSNKPINIELNSKPKPFKPFNSNIDINNNNNNIRPAIRQNLDDINNSYIYKAQPINNNNNVNTKSFLSPSTDSFKLNNQNNNDSINNGNLLFEPQYRRNSELVKSVSTNTFGPKALERSASVTFSDSKEMYKYFSNGHLDHDDDDKDNKDVNKKFNKIDEIKQKRQEVKKTIQARLIEALSKSRPIVVNECPPSKYNGINNDKNNNHIEYDNYNTNNNNASNLRNQLKNHLNIKVADISEDKPISVENIHKPQSSPISSHKSPPFTANSYSNYYQKNFIPNFSNNSAPSQPEVQQHQQQHAPPPPRNDYYAVQQPYQPQYVPPVQKPQQVPFVPPPPPSQSQHQPQIRNNYAQPAPPPVQSPVQQAHQPHQQHQPPPPFTLNLPSGPRNLNRGLRGSAIRKLDHPTIPACPSCNQVIRGPFISAVGKTWCPNHFTCASCGVNLEDIGFIEENGKLYCENDFEKYFAPKCAKCNRAIIGDCCYAIQKSYHPDCFTCTHCNKKIASGGFHVEDGRPFCVKDYNQLFSAKCAGCNFPIEASDQFVEALNNNWHVECFTCTACHTKLEGIGFVVKSNKPYCKKHAR